MRNQVLEVVKTVATAAVGAAIILQFIMPTTVFGNSMEPNFSDRDYVLLDRQAYRGVKTPEHGDIIVFESHLKDEKGNNKRLIKRVIGVAGDSVSVQDGEVFVNGVAIDDSYTMDGTTNGNVRQVTVPEGSVFCLGDNRLHSIDSRYREVGFVDEEDIMGKVFVRILPVKNMGFVSHK